MGEARALYNLGNVYHAKAKQIGRTGNLADMSSVSGDGCSQEARILLQTAAKYYEFVRLKYLPFLIWKLNFFLKMFLIAHFVLQAQVLGLAT